MRLDVNSCGALTYPISLKISLGLRVRGLITGTVFREQGRRPAHMEAYGSTDIPYSIATTAKLKVGLSIKRHRVCRPRSKHDLFKS